ncbi:hypothetical protein QE152_g24860 [Popillia japonica]|uniref:Uncharacterized protein n=1 Tax=Popillia japonica TaxID=7064 RepID=A0AAW1K5I0_POPJA
MGVWSANSNPEQDPDASPEQLMRLYRQLSHFHQPVVSRRSTTVEFAQTVSGNINMKSRHQFRRRFSLQPAFLKEEEEEPQKNVPK